jgi:hypothetical protein
MGDLGDDAVVAEVVAVRRAPRYRAFVGVGALAFAVVAALVTLVADGLPGLVVVLLAGGAAVLGGLLGALIAVLADRSTAR